MGAPTPSTLSASGTTHRGHVRCDNQDVIIVEPDLGLYAVLDGMGGANAGDVAANLAARHIVASIRQNARIRRRWPRRALDIALQAAAVEVFSAAVERPDYRGMGTTVVACLVADPAHAVIAHAGDSRAYLLRDGRLAPLTRDHTSAPNLLTRNLGRECGVVPDVLELPLTRGDRLLLCSDGLYAGAPMTSLRRILGSIATPELIAHRLVARVLDGEAFDNASAVVITVGDGRARAAMRPSSRVQAPRTRARSRATTARPRSRATTAR
jgi:serine/threonine protein phosphatase PrpC